MGLGWHTNLLFVYEVLPIFKQYGFCSCIEQNSGNCSFYSSSCWEFDEEELIIVALLFNKKEKNEFKTIGKKKIQKITVKVPKVWQKKKFQLKAN